MSSTAWIISVASISVLLLAVSVYVAIRIYKLHMRKKRKEYGGNLVGPDSGDEVTPRKKGHSLRLPDSTIPPFSTGDVRPVHIQPNMQNRKISEPNLPRKYPDSPQRPQRKISEQVLPFRERTTSEVLPYRERSRTLSESRLSPATPLGTLDPQLYSFEEIDDPFEQSITDAPCLGQVQFIIEYDMHRHVLNVRLVRAINLSFSIMDDTDDERDTKTCNPYAIVQLLPDYRHQLQSNVQRKTQNPRFDETFEFDIQLKSLQQQSLWITILSFETFSKHDVIGQVVVPLNDINFSQENVYLKELSPSAKEVQLGEILISLGYLKSAERLTLVVIKARNLPAVNIKGTDPYVKVTLLQDGKRLKKKKTTTKKGDLNPVFNEAISFDLTADLLDSVDLLVSVMHGNDVIGAVLIGSHAKENEAKLWVRMHSSNRPLPLWSKLQDPKLYY